MKRKREPFLWLAVIALCIAYVGMAISLRQAIRENDDLRDAIRTMMIPRAAGEANKEHP